MEVEERILDKVIAQDNYIEWLGLNKEETLEIKQVLREAKIKKHRERKAAEKEAWLKDYTRGKIEFQKRGGMLKFYSLRGMSSDNHTPGHKDTWSG